MRIVACYKTVPDEQDITANSDRTLSFGREWKISEYDLNALEAAVQFAETTDSEVIALSVGGEAVDNSKLKKNALSRGVSELYTVSDEAVSDADCYTTAQILAAAITTIGNVDLVVCGEGSGDLYNQQVGNYLGYILGFSTVNAISSLENSGDKLRAERSLEDYIEELEIRLPAVVSVTSDINKPRIPGLKDIMAAGKKPTTSLGIKDLAVEIAPKSQVIKTLAPETQDRLRYSIEGSDDAQIEEFVGIIRKSLAGGGN
jgi:electron transfer flavoprotein beta subunit